MPRVEHVWRPTKAQEDILKSKARFRFACFGRRAGKTACAAVDCIAQSERRIKMGHNPDAIQIWWVAPSWEQANRGYAAFTRPTSENGEVNPIFAAVASYRWSNDRREVTLKNGVSIHFKSGEREDQLQGEGLHHVVIDEAASTRELVWSQYLYPALAISRGTAFGISTPKGRNWFYQEWLKGQDPLHTDHDSWNLPSSCNPHIPLAFLEEARRDLPDRVYRQEIQAEFLDDSGGVFEGVRGCVNAAITQMDGPVEGREYTLGWDPAKHTDYSAWVVLDVTDRPYTPVAWGREQKVPYPEQVRRRAAMARKWNAAVLLDSTGGGDPIYDYMRDEDGIDVTGYKFTATSKADLINNHATTIADKGIAFPDEPVVVNEHEVYEWKANGGSGHPDGGHDDTVMAYALAAWHGTHRNTWGSLELDWLDDIVDGPAVPQRGFQYQD